MKEIKNKNAVNCPKCGKEATMKSTSSQLMYGAFICLLSLSVSLWIPIVGWICTPIFAILTIILFISSILAKIQGGAMIECKECNSKYNITKQEYKRMKSN